MSGFLAKVTERKMNNWIVVSNEGSEYLKEILVFLQKRFIEIFGEETMNAEGCYVYNRSNADCPMLITNAKPICIRLAQSSLSFWAQTIYQLSHEMCHYAIRQHKVNKDFTLKWFEEITCEAASLYFLQYAAINWKKCRLSKMNPSFCTAIESYLSKEISKPATNTFQECNTVEKLKVNELMMESDRAGHRNERNIIYRALSDEPEDLRVLCDYMNYLQKDKVTLDFDRWIRDNNCVLLQAFKTIVPVK